MLNNGSGKEEQFAYNVEVLLYELLGSVASPSKLLEFIERLAYNGALAVIADAHFQAAYWLATENADAVDKKSQVQDIKQLLESAHAEYAQWNSWKAKAFSFALSGRQIVLCRKDSYTCCLLAACSLYLGEKKLALIRAIDGKYAVKEEKRVTRYMLARQGISAASVFIPPVSLASGIVLMVNSADGLVMEMHRRKIPHINEDQIEKYIAQLLTVRLNF